MVVTYHLDETDLDENFYLQLKSQFKNKKLFITVAEEMDETEYLLASPANAERLLKSIENVNAKKGLITVDFDNLDQLI
jgi:hypothetical protein